MAKAPPTARAHPDLLKSSVAQEHAVADWLPAPSGPDPPSIAVA